MKLVGDRVYVEAHAKIADTESSEFLEAFASAREALDQKGMQDSQLTGSTSSYARKYCLNGLFCIDDTKDADAQKPVAEEPKKDSFTDKMRGYATNEGDIYWAIMEANNYKKASDVPVKEQAIILKQLDSELKKGV